MQNEWRKIWSFIAVSGIGWIVDFGIYSCLIGLMKFSPIESNLISAAVAVIFVFFISVYKIFLNERKFIVGGLILYLIYQAGSIYGFSFLINLSSNYITSLKILPDNIVPILMKCFYTPFTLVTNYLFMRFLTVKVLGTKKAINTNTVL
ncbi:GtrA family protein [Paenibacillus camerounensis]|uniref:GtrA family protein n=1 Tax=Paenibacillus camerounensis TaxID=1243663 RepID=UPI0005A8AF25|nr:GtrA family protein [Paenibacillus camerounensis]